MTNKKIRKFLRHPRPKYDECISGYLIRLAEANGYSLRDIWVLFGFDSKNKRTKRPLDYIYSRADYSVLSKRTGFSDETLKRLAFQPVQVNTDQFKGTYDFFGNQIGSHTFRYKTSTLCPDCLVENPYQRKIWDLLPVTACPFHKRLLIDHCPGCEKPIYYRRDQICFCACGYDFRDSENDVVSDEDVRLVTRIYQLCGFIPDIKNHLTNVAPELLNLDLSSLLHCVFLTSGQIAADGGIRGKFLSLITIKERHQMLSAAVKIYDNFPHNFLEFLESLKNDSWKLFDVFNNANYKNLKRNVFERVCELINKYMEDSQFDFLRQALNEFKGREKLISYGINIDHAKTSSNEFFNNHLPLFETAQYLKISKKVAEEMVKTGALKAYVIKKENGKSDYFISLSSIEYVKKRLDEVISVSDATRMVGLHLHQMNSILNEGIIKLVEDIKIVPVFSRVVEKSHVLDLYDLFYKAMRKNPVYKRIGKKISSTKTIVPLGFLKIDFGKMTRMIFDGEIAPAGHNGTKGINGFIYDESQIKAIVNRNIENRLKGTFSLAEVVKILRVKKSIVQHLIRKGYFPVVDMKSVLGKRIPQNKFEEFQSEFILSAEIARKFSTSAIYANEKLAAKNIFPVDDTFDQNNHLYRRNDVKGITIKKPNPAEWTYRKRRTCLMSPEKAAKTLGLSEEHLNFAVERKLIYLTRGKYRSERLFSEAGLDSFRKLNLPHVNFLREKEAVEMLGITLDSFKRRYLKTKLIIPEVRPFGTNSVCRFYSIDDLENLKDES